MKQILLAAFVAVLVAATLRAGDAKDKGWTLDRSHSSVAFSVKHMIISDVTGNFKSFDITMTGTKEDFSDASVTATIKVATISTDNDQRDGHLKSDDFFNAEKYPTITFKSTGFEKVDDKHFHIVGDLTIRDVTKKVTFDAVYNGSVKAPWGATVTSWKATTAVNRFDYNLKWNKALETGGLVVGETVNITLNLEFNR